MTSSPALAHSAYEAALDGGTVSTAFLLNIAYVNGAPFQWAHEWNRNIEHVFQRMVAEGLDTSKVKSVYDFVHLSVMRDSDHDLDVVADPIKRRIWNIGKPMDPHTELLPFYSALNVGGGANRWSPENPTGSYGMGLRAALLYWTDVAFISSVPGLGSYVIVLRAVKDADGQVTYSAVKPTEFDAGDGHARPADDLMVRLGDGFYIMSPEDTYIELAEGLVSDEVAAEGGFTAVLLGKGDYTADVEHDETVRGGLLPETRRGLVTAIQDHEVGGSFPIEVFYLFESKAEAEGKRARVSLSVDRHDGSTTYGDRRVIKPLTDWTDRGECLTDGRDAQHMPVVLDEFGSTAQVYLLSEDYFHVGVYTDEEKEKYLAANPDAIFEFRSDKLWGLVPRTVSKDSWMHFSGQGHVVVKFGTELYPLTELSNERRTSVLGRWGISRESVARRTLIVIEPAVASSFTTWGVTQNQARSGLVTSGGGPLPRDSWANAFLDAFPAGLAAALAVIPPVKTRHISKDEIERLRERFFGKKAPRREKAAVAVITESEREGEPGVEAPGIVLVGPGYGVGEGGGGGGVVERERGEIREGGAKKVTRRRPTLPEPSEPYFIDADEWAARGYPERQFCRINAVGADYEIVLNRGHRILHDQIRYYWTDDRNGYFAPSARRKVRAKILAKFGGASSAGVKDKVAVALQEELEYVYRLHALAIVMGAQAIYLDARGDFDRSAFSDQYVNGSMAATTALAGLIPQAAEIQSRINGMAAAS